MLQAEDLALDRGDIGTSVQPGEIVTIMFTDIEGFAALTERLGDWQAQQILHAHAALVREQIRSYGGFEVNTLGDGFMVAFPSARRALRCAVAVQRAVDTHSRRHPGEQIRVRIGLHTGEAIRDGNDFCGKTVIIAARVTDEAEGGEILVSAALKRTVESPGEFLFDDERVVELKGLAGPYPLFGVPWAMDGSVRPAPRRVLADALTDGEIGATGWSAVPLTILTASFAAEAARSTGVRSRMPSLMFATSSSVAADGSIA